MYNAQWACWVNNKKKYKMHFSLVIEIKYELWEYNTACLLKLQQLITNKIITSGREWPDVRQIFPAIWTDGHLNISSQVSIWNVYRNNS